MTEINKLIQELKNADNLYYGDGNSVMSDKEYDEKKNKLLVLDPNNSYLKEVASENIDDSHWEKEQHEYPLGSLDKVNKLDELIKWHKDYMNRTFLVEEKLDGISIALTYENSKLVKAITRGKDGIGENITRNVKKMKGVPQNITYAEKLVIRAEIVMTKDDFENLPEGSKKKNPRNAAAGAAKKLTGDLCGYLTVICYDILNRDGKMKESECCQLLKSLNFTTVSYYFVKNVEEINKIYSEYEKMRASLNWDIDGLVIKVNEQGDDTGSWEHPKTKVAWKFEHQEASTILEGVSISVRGSRLQPVAILTPVDVAGVTVSRASLHNFQYIKNLGLTIGAKVLITRRNDVIPQIEQVLIPGTIAIDIPMNCPVCSSETTWELNTAKECTEYLICPNPECDAKVTKSIMKWLEIHDTKGIAKKTVELLYENSIITSLPDFIDIKNGNFDSKITSIDGMGIRKLEILKKELESCSLTDINKFYAGINLHGSGRRVIEKITTRILELHNKVDCNLFEEFCNGNIESNLCTVEGFAVPSAKRFQEELINKKELIMNMKKAVTIESLSKKEKTSSSSGISGQSFCFTGALNTMNRKEAQAMVTNACGIVKDSVGAGLTYLVTNDPNSGSSKNEKAQKFGTKLITEEQFVSLLGK